MKKNTNNYPDKAIKHVVTTNNQETRESSHKIIPATPSSTPRGSAGERDGRR